MSYFTCSSVWALLMFKYSAMELTPLMQSLLWRTPRAWSKWCSTILWTWTRPNQCNKNMYVMHKMLIMSQKRKRSIQQMKRNHVEQRYCQGPSKTNILALDVSIETSTWLVDHACVMLIWYGCQPITWRFWLYVRRQPIQVVSHGNYHGILHPITW